MFKYQEKIAMHIKFISCKHTFIFKMSNNSFIWPQTDMLSEENFCFNLNWYFECSVKPHKAFLITSRTESETNSVFLSMNFSWNNENYLCEFESIHQTSMHFYRAIKNVASKMTNRKTIFWNFSTGRCQDIARIPRVEHIISEIFGWRQLKFRFIVQKSYDSFVSIANQICVNEKKII